MPSALIKKYAEETGKAVSDVEDVWDSAKSAAEKKFKDQGPRYWAYVNDSKCNINSVLVAGGDIE